MSGEINLNKLLKTMKPIHNPGEYVFCVVADMATINSDDVIMIFKEAEGNTIVLKKELADSLGLSYSFIAAWITLNIHSSLDAVGFTAAFSTALAKNGIGCNVVAAVHHDHIFVNIADVEKAMKILGSLSQ